MPLICHVLFSALPKSVHTCMLCCRQQIPAEMQSCQSRHSRISQQVFTSATNLSSVASSKCHCHPHLFHCQVHPFPPPVRVKLVMKLANFCYLEVSDAPPPPHAIITSSMLEDYIKRVIFDGKILASNMDSDISGGS